MLTNPPHKSNQINPQELRKELSETSKKKKEMTVMQELRMLQIKTRINK